MPRRLYTVSHKLTRENPHSNICRRRVADGGTGSNNIDEVHREVCLHDVSIEPSRDKSDCYLAHGANAELAQLDWSEFFMG